MTRPGRLQATDAASDSDSCSDTVRNSHFPGRQTAGGPLADNYLSSWGRGDGPIANVAVSISLLSCKNIVQSKRIISTRFFCVLGKVFSPEMLDEEVFLPVHDRYYLTFRTSQEVSDLLSNMRIDQTYFQVSMEQFDSECSVFCPSGLHDIYRFYSLVRKILRQGPNVKIIFCAGRVEVVQIGSAFLLGCFLILQGLDCEKAKLAFSSCDQLFKGFEYTDCLQISDFWGAIHNAKVLSSAIQIPEPRVDRFVSGNGLA